MTPNHPDRSPSSPPTALDFHRYIFSFLGLPLDASGCFTAPTMSFETSPPEVLMPKTFSVVW
jgi:hypothetical protein